MANVKHIAGCMSQSLKLIFDYVRVDRMMEVAQDHSVRSFPPRLVGMVKDIVGPKFCNQPAVGFGIINIDFNCIICKGFEVVPLFLKNGGDLRHHILVIGDVVYIYCRGFMFPLLCGA